VQSAVTLTGTPVDKIDINQNITNLNNLLITPLKYSNHIHKEENDNIIV
jgi:hypothetical protein